MTFQCELKLGGQSCHTKFNSYQIIKIIRNHDKDENHSNDHDHDDDDDDDPLLNIPNLINSLIYILFYFILFKIHFCLNCLNCFYFILN